MRVGKACEDPGMAHLLSVNVGVPRETEWATIGRTSIDKSAVEGPVHVRALGIEGDQVSNRKYHGGLDKAVYAFAAEDLQLWAERLGEPVAPGRFGENLTTEGIDVNEAEIGERWRIGTVLLEVRSVRTPCAEFKRWMGHCGYDDRAWVKRFAAEGRPGPYLRVLEEGVLRAGDAVEVVHRPGHGVSVSTFYRAISTDRTLLPRLLEISDLVPEAREKAERYVRDLDAGREDAVLPG